MAQRDDTLSTADLAGAGGDTAGDRDSEATIGVRGGSADDASPPNAAERLAAGREGDVPGKRTERVRQAGGEQEDPRGATPLLVEAEAIEYRQRWEQIQTGFVDRPRRVVEDADALVAELMQRLADSFARERATLERQWDRGDDVTTEDLRVALQRYRSFFDRLLST